MSEPTPRIRNLLRQAEKVMEAGKRSAAVGLYQQIIEEAPDTAAAYLGLAEALSDPEDKKEAYTRALELEPSLAAAAAGLLRLEGEQVPAELLTQLEPEPSKVTPRAEPRSESPVSRAAGVNWENASTLRERFDEVRMADETQATDTAVTVCYRHPDTETSLRCNRCNKPICIKCAKRTSVGYRCPDCIREIEEESGYYTATLRDYVVAALVALPLGLLSGWLVLNFLRGGFFVIIIIFFIGASIGGGIARLASLAVGGRRGRQMPKIVAAAVAIGGLGPALFFFLLTFNIGILLYPAIFTFIATSAAYAQMR